MGYKVIKSIDLERYTEREGLEGPFNFNGKALYYCAKEGAYYDPDTDMFLSYDEYLAYAAQLKS